MRPSLHEHAGPAAALPLLRRRDMGPRLRHRALLLIGPHRLPRIDAVLARRLLDRLLAPAAQVEGVDLHLADPRLAEAGAMAEGFALLLPPAGNLTNPFYAVHPRRNDRFVTARPALKALFPEVDFAAFAFTGHALATLAATCPERFSVVRQGVASAWCVRMRLLLDRLPRRGVLIDVPGPAWMQRPALPGSGWHRLAIDPDDRAAGAVAFRAALSGHGV